MTHRPTLFDAAADLRRCIYASLSSEGFNNPNFHRFLSHALGIIDQIEDAKEPRVLEIVNRCLSRAQGQDIDSIKAREDLLMAALLLQG